MMTEKNQEVRKSFGAVLGVMFLISLSAITFFNTYRLSSLQNEVLELRFELYTLMRTRIPRNSEDNSVQQIHKKTKRDVVGVTEDQVLVSSESYLQHNRHNQTRKYPSLKGLFVSSMPAQYSQFESYERNPNLKGDATRKPLVNVRTSRNMHYEDKSKTLKLVVKRSEFKSLDTSAYASNEYNTGSSESEFPANRDEGVVVRRTNRPRMQVLDERNPRTGRIKPLPTIHFGGDTSRYVLGTHENYNGNGHLRHPQRKFVDWKASNWVEKSGMNSHFSFQDGYLSIKESGMYFVYAQIYYLDEHDRNGYRVYKNDDGILQCTVSSHSSSRIQKGNTCYTAGVEYLAEGDKISIGDLSDERYSLFESGKSFFGVIKLGDIKLRP